jgi:uncharacterized membrane protein
LKIPLISFLIETIGFSVCHQIPMRSLLFGNLILPVCARCCGFYTGFFITAIILFIMFRKRESDLPPAYILIILAFFLLSFIIDGIASNFGLYNTNNNLRFVTGTLCGSSIIIILYPVFIFQYYKNPSPEKIFKSPFKFMACILLMTFFILITLSRFSFLGYFYFYLTALSILFTFYFINLSVILLIPCFSKKATELLSGYLVLPSIIAAALSFIELFAFYWSHKALELL